MSCPRCGARFRCTFFDGRLRDATSGRAVRVEMDECPKGCGFWFDRLEAEATLGMKGELQGDEQSSACLPCPKSDGGQLRPMLVLGIQLDRCDACAGLWFDTGEMKKISSALETAGVRLGDTATYTVCSGCGRSGFDPNDMYFGASGMMCPECFLGDDLSALERKVELEKEMRRYGRNSTSLDTLIGLVNDSPTLDDID